MFDVINDFLKNINEFIKLAILLSGLFPSFFLIKKAWKKSDKINETRRQTALVYNNLNHVSTAGAARVMLLMAKPKPLMNVLKNSYGYVLHEIYNKPVESARNNWNKQLLDANYIKMLRDLENQKHLKIYTDYIESEVLSTIYKSQNIVMSDVFSIYADDNQIIYLSINYDNFDPINEDGQAEIVTAVNNLRNLFQDNPEL